MRVLSTKDPAHVRYLVEEILEVCQDMKSARFYSKVARALPDDMIFRFLSEIKQDPKINNRGAVFTTKVKRYASRHEQCSSLCRKPKREKR